MKKYRTHIIIATTLAISLLFSCRLTDTTGKNAEVAENITSNVNGSGTILEFSFAKGESFNHPSFVLWIEDTAGNYIQTLFITKSYGSGTFIYGDKSGGKWKPSQVKRPATLPYWSHKTGEKQGSGIFIPDSVHPVADAYTGATPKSSFKLKTRSDKENLGKAKIMFEINQTWDWNEYWTNAMYQDDSEYRTSCQPAIVYEAVIDLQKKGVAVDLKPIGRSSHNGADGKLYNDLNTLTSA